MDRDTLSRRQVLFHDGSTKTVPHTAVQRQPPPRVMRSALAPPRQAADSHPGQLANETPQAALLATKYSTMLLNIARCY